MKNEIVVCSECGKRANKNKVFIVDEQPICFTCMYGDTKPVEIYPIGEVTTDLKPDETDDFSADPTDISRIDLLPSQERFMYKLEEEKFLLIVYYLHEVNSVRTVFNRRLDGKKVGVFSARTPHRLSKIAVQDVKLLKVQGNSLYVDGLDAREGSPVLDIKLGLRSPARLDR